MNETSARVLGKLDVLCVGNGGLIRTSGQFLTHRSMAEFLAGVRQRVAGVTFCHWVEPEDDPLARTPLLEDEGSQVIELRPIRGHFVRRAMSAAGALIRLTRAVARADFVYIYWPGRLAEVAARVCVALSRPYAFYLRGGDDAAVHQIAPLLRRAKFAIAAGSALLDGARTHCRRVEMVTPMVAVRPHHLSPPRARVPGAPLRLLYVGRIEPSKGIVELLRACELLSERATPVELSLVGQCVDPPWVAAHVDACRAPVRLVGPTTDFEALADLYRTSDVFVLPSHSEGFPRVLYEAMAFGTTIVTTFVGGIPALLSDGVDCLRIAVADPEDVAGRIATLHGDDMLRIRLATQAQHKITALMDTWRTTHAEQMVRALAGTLEKDGSFG